MVVGVCRGCTCNTDRVATIAGKPMALCLECNEAWANSGEAERADRKAEEVRKSVSGPDAVKARVINAAVMRAFQDFLYRVQKERVAHGRVSA